MKYTFDEINMAIGCACEFKSTALDSKGVIINGIINKIIPMLYFSGMVEIQTKKNKFGVDMSQIINIPAINKLKKSKLYELAKMPSLDGSYWTRAGHSFTITLPSHTTIIQNICP